jgi:flagellar biosynthesis protein FlhB
VADDKTEEPTPKRLRQAREDGDIAMSRDAMGAAVYLAIFATVSMGAATTVTKLMGYMRISFETATGPFLVNRHLVRMLMAMADALKTPLLAAFVVALGIGFMQSGGLFSVKALKVDFKKVMPNFKKFVSMNALVELLKGVVKVALTAAVAWMAVRALVGSMVKLAGASPLSVMTVLGYAIDNLCRYVALIVVAVGGGDFLWQRHSHKKKLMMSKEEVKREHKDQEGDPHHKHERKRLHKELLEQRMVNSVRKADFVVVNPDHIAVAIQYDKEGNSAPLVVAKGERLLAEKIKEVAREAGVPIFRDVSLARALRDVEEGDEIPEALYEAVAEILRVVYGEQPRAGEPAAQTREQEPPQSPPEARPLPPAGGWRRA